MSEQVKQMTDQELMDHMRHCIENYSGSIEYLNEAVGLLVVGRIMGWKHQRIVTSRRAWNFARDVFGDPKSPQFMPDRTPTGDRKSVALGIADKLGGYLQYVKGLINIPKDERKMLQ